MNYKYCNIAEKYIDDVLTGKQITGEFVKLAVKRHLKDIETAPEKGFYFDKEAAEHAIKFKTLFSHTYGELSGERFEPMPWQCFMDYCVYGWKKSNGRRRFSTAYIEVAKKNGKTAKIALDGIYLLAGDKSLTGKPKHGVEIYCAATKERQAKECFNQAADFISVNTNFKNHYNPNIVSNNISIKKTFAKFEPLGRDSKGVDGKRPDGVVIDEYHEWDRDDVRHRLRSASVGKVNYLEWIITTAGFDKTGPCFQWRNYCLDILRGIKVQEDVFVLIFSLDENDDWKNQEIWVKANPNYGVSVDKENMIKLFNEAQNRGGTTEVDFLTKNLNRWVDAPTVWIRDDFIIKANYGTSLEKLKGKDCFVGIDLASKQDITAVALFFPEINGKSVVKFHYWIPEQKVIDKQDRVDYRTWVQQNYITATPGNLIDTEIFKNEFLSLIEPYNIKSIGYDPWGAEHGFVQKLEELNLFHKLDRVNQDAKTLTPGTKKLADMLVGGEIDLLGDPVIRWMFRNVVILQYDNNLIKPDRKRSNEKIDGVAALINAITTWQSPKEPEPYKNHDIREINF